MSVFIFRFLVLIAFTLSSFVLGNSALIKSKIDALSEVKTEDYLSKLVLLKKEILDYIANKKRVCSGEFSTVVLGELEKGGEEKKLLSKEERLLCYREVQEIEQIYITTLLDGRISYMKMLHAQEIDKLTLMKKQLLDKIEKDYAYTITTLNKMKEKRPSVQTQKGSQPKN